MSVDVDSGVLRLIWADMSRSGGMCFPLSDGSLMTIRNGGEEDMVSGIFCGAELETDGVRMRGDVVFGGNDLQEGCSGLGYVVLQVVATSSPFILNRHGERIAQLVVEVPEWLNGKVENLKRSAGSAECAMWLGTQPSPVRLSVMERLLWERLERKCGEVVELAKASDNDWAQTLYVMLFRAMGGNKNKPPYIRLASTATYHMVLRERGSIDCVEALLLGSAGMLEGLYFDDYIRRLRDHFVYLVRKYGIVPMKPDEWEMWVRSVNLPLIRIVQLASFVARNDFMFDRVMSCRNAEDVRLLFDVELSGYWATHYSPDLASGRRMGRIGSQKADLLAVNAVVPVMLAYGEYSGNIALKEAAIELLGSIPAESNGIVNNWSAKGVNVVNAADSQSVMQLNNEYCAFKKCADCKVGRGIIKQTAGVKYS